jgi:trimeric autotransporter adhesin
VTLTGEGEAGPQVSSGGIGGGGGGCSIASGESPFDPTLWLIVLVAGGVLLYRRRQSGARSVSDREC